MSFDVSTSAVVGVLNEVNPKLQSYQELFQTFGENIQALAEATKAEPVGTALQGVSGKAFQPAMSNVAGRTGNAVNAVNEVLRILTSADQHMSATARQSAAKAAQAKADDAPEPVASGPESSRVR